jgi:hypothetical protein
VNAAVRSALLALNDFAISRSSETLQLRHVS